MRNHADLMQIITHLNGAVSNARLYSPDHPQVALLMARVHAKLISQIKAHSDLTFIIIDKDVIVDNQAITPVTPQLTQFIDVFNQCAIQRITFTDALSIDELTRLEGSDHRPEICCVGELHAAALLDHR